MADVSDIEQALVNLIADIFYPNGTANPSAVGAPVSVYRGWPVANDLDADVKAGRVNITVFPDPGMTRNVTRYWPQTVQVAVVEPTIIATDTDSGATVTLSGTITAGNVVGVQFGAGAQAVAYAYRVLAGDTLPSVAAALAALIPGAISAGPVLTLPSNVEDGAAVMTPQPVSTEVRRQDQGFRISCWCANPTQRDIVAGLVDRALAGLRDANGNFTRFLTITSGGEVGWIRYLRSYTFDNPSKDAVWRRDLLYEVEYSTALLETEPVMLFGVGTLANY